MEPTLHQHYTPDEAVAAFGGGANPEFACDSQFAVLAKDILCFATVGDAATDPHLSSPSCVVWKPHRLDYDASDEYPWLPAKAREIYDRSQKPVRKLKDHHVFLRLATDDRFFYAGRAHLGCYGGPMTGGTAAARSAEFSLKEKLPRDVWWRLGGYRGWLVEVNHEIHRVDEGDLQTFRHLADELPRQEFSHLRMTRYQEDSLTVHTNSRRGWLMYLSQPDDSGVYAQDAGYTGAPEVDEAFRCVCGISLEFPAPQTLPRDLAIRVAEEFFVAGGLPDWVPWSEE